MTSFVKAVDVHGLRHEASTRSALALHAEQERQDALAAAYGRGHDDGRAEALAESVAAGPRVASMLDELARRGSQQRSDAGGGTCREVVAGAIDIAEWVLRHELSQDSRGLLTRLAEATTALLPSGQTRVSVAPADEEAVRRWSDGHGIEVVVDHDLLPGDALLDNGIGSVDLTVTAALRIAAEALAPQRGGSA